MRPNEYLQCRLIREGSTQVAFIPSVFAQPGRRIGLKVDGVWEEGWEVLEVWPGAVSEAAVTAQGRYHKSHRKGTDI